MSNDVQPALVGTTDSVSIPNSFQAPDGRPHGTVSDGQQPNNDQSPKEVHLMTATLPGSIQPLCACKKLTRKRVIKQDEWKSTKRLKAAQHGEAYKLYNSKRFAA